MTYSKPELHVIGSAVAVVQKQQSTTKGGSFNDRPDLLIDGPVNTESTAAAYEAGE